MYVCEMSDNVDIKSLVLILRTEMQCWSHWWHQDPQHLDSCMSQSLLRMEATFIKNAAAVPASPRTLGLQPSIDAGHLNISLQKFLRTLRFGVSTSWDSKRLTTTTMACVPEIIAGTIPVGLNQRRVQNMHCVYSLQCFRSEPHTVTTEYIRRDARV